MGPSLTGGKRGPAGRLALAAAASDCTRSGQVPARKVFSARPHDSDSTLSSLHSTALPSAAMTRNAGRIHSLRHYSYLVLLRADSGKLSWRWCLLPPASAAQAIRNWSFQSHGWDPGGSFRLSAHTSASYIQGPWHHPTVYSGNLKLYVVFGVPQAWRRPRGAQAFIFLSPWPQHQPQGTAAPTAPEASPSGILTHTFLHLWVYDLTIKVRGEARQQGRAATSSVSSGKVPDPRSREHGDRPSILVLSPFLLMVTFSDLLCPRPPHLMSWGLILHHHHLQAVS
ncbi:hypothetical protein H920_17607 [Fukomys damarensis]|uniref:Uncharacterized protein n=1 Tax=Fukomys damarensis TaxID=885580 RepID=A0A091CPL0_FUKDA|nr:hypothetical protein H920_17607 [Fukomys damarensis]